MEKMRMESLNLTSQNIEKIEDLFPNCITESKDKNGKLKKSINFKMLKQMLSDDIVDGEEAYEFTWVGKKESIVEANKPIRKTLRPAPEESVDWENTENLYIEGDNLEVLKLLQESYLGKVKMIYIDPPYNTGNDFIYNDDFKVSNEEYAEESGEYDEDGNRMFKNTDSNGRFHSDWCSMMYSRLLVAKNLLREDGVIFISIDDNELENLKKICDEIMGEENFLLIMPRQTKKSGKTTTTFSKNHDYIIVYRKSESVDFKMKEHIDDNYKNKDEFEERGLYKLNQTLDYDSLSYSKSLDYPLEIEGEVFYPGGDKAKWEERQSGNHRRADWAWRWNKKLFEFAYENGFVVLKRKTDGSARIYTKTYLNARINKKINGEYYIEYVKKTKATSSLEYTENKYSNDNAKKDLKKLNLDGKFDYSKPIELLKDLIKYCVSSNDIVLDFFSGSATTAQAVMELNIEDGESRKFILVQLPEKTDEKIDEFNNICEIGKERIRRAGDKIKSENPLLTSNLDTGFRVLKVDSSNMKDVYYSPNKISQDFLSSLESNIKEDRTDLDLLFGCLLEWGLPLSLPYKSIEIDGCMVHNYNDGDLIACFEENISENVMKEIAKLTPLRAVFRDSSFENSAEKINTSEIFKLLSPDTKIKVI